MGPNLYVTPPASFTHFHQDGHGTVDSGHLCISGFNEVIMLRRLTERHKRHALWILSGKQPNGSHFDGLYSVPHGDGLVGVQCVVCSKNHLVWKVASYINRTDHHCSHLFCLHISILDLFIL
jgi:hypothetical protein